MMVDIGRADQRVRTRWQIELDDAGAVRSSQSYDTLIGRIKHRHLVSVQSGVRLGQFLDLFP